ncbi:MAG: NYN domain-containing protein [Treponema sp.]|jgi:uncharacterized LabA/DUF88 family protein|nr:NYN domain-containing protein [Treponema sp.]
METKKTFNVFFDGYYFYKIYNHYLTQKTVFNFEKFIDFIRYEISSYLRISMDQCEAGDVHFYIGGVADTFGQKQLERALVNAGLGNNIHRSRLIPTINGEKEKGVDGRLMLDAYKSAVAKKYDVLVLIAGDADFIPLVEDITELNIPVFLVCWDEKATLTATAMDLINSVTCALPMNEILQSKIKKNPFVKDLLRTESAVPATRNGTVPAPQDLRDLLLETAAECTPREDGWILGADFGLILTKVKKYDPKEKGKRLYELFEDYPDLFETRPDPFAVRLRTQNGSRSAALASSSPAAVSGPIPRLLTPQELAVEHESVIFKMIVPDREFGFIRSAQEYANNKWNNHNFFASEVLNRRKEDLVEGMKVKFRLAYDSFRSTKYGAPLYRAEKITVLD